MCAVSVDLSSTSDRNLDVEGFRMAKDTVATAVKERGAEWYYPAVKTAFGPKRLPHGERQESRYLAVKEAHRIISESGAEE